MRSFLLAFAFEAANVTRCVQLLSQQRRCAQECCPPVAAAAGDMHSAMT